jgi:hypothetical protein
VTVRVWRGVVASTQGGRGFGDRGVALGIGSRVLGGGFGDRGETSGEMTRLAAVARRG